MSRMARQTGASRDPDDMNERWQNISRLFNEAQGRDARERRAFLEEACGGDDALQRELESLLAQASAGSRFLNDPAMGAAARLLIDEAGSLVGTQIGPYQLVSALGAGGMGVVYRALDTKLHRPVAIKFLSDDLADAV